MGTDVASKECNPILFERFFQKPLPEKFLNLSEEEMDHRIAKAKRELGQSLVILGHHYQRDEVIKFADYTGDSLKLSQHAASRKEAPFIVFCGVHFMAESADILTGPHQKVILPDLNAGCSMADMADIDQVEECWYILQEFLEVPPIPITYMNSEAALKAFCGKNEGIVCTSSNASKTFEWAFAKGEKVLFFPDEHLGRNTAFKKGYHEEDLVVWNPHRDLGGTTPERLKRAKVILWKGCCSVHMQFTPNQVLEVRERYPGIRVIVHPECRREVVELADEDGSTEFIGRRIKESSPGTQWAIGTEPHLVNRLTLECQDKLVLILNPSICLCATMYRIDYPHLLWVLENLLDGNVVNQITVPEETASWARVALDRMLSIH
jgi:quinolinate synthase